jgi:toxin-antitoxin system PIN domain toxin
MNRHLLDVNLLLALLWPRHESHVSAHAWFAKSGRRAWATNPLTQLGVLRLLTNPSVTQGAVSASDALEALYQATRSTSHEFWPLDRKMPAGLKTLVGGITGHRQWTDAALLWQAIDRDGVVVTFDAGMKELAAREWGDRILLLTCG